MKFNSKLTAGFLVAILVATMLLGITAPAAAQPAQAQNNANTEVQTGAQASAQPQGIMTALTQIQQQLKDIQQRLTVLEDKVNTSGNTKSEVRATENSEFTGQTVATGELNSNGQKERQGPPAHAQNDKANRGNSDNNLGSQVSAEAKAGDKKGMMATISAWLSARGNTEAAEAVNSSRDTDRDNQEDRESDEKEESEISINTTGDVETGENVTITATQNGEPIENATVKVNGETIGQTDSNGQIVLKVPQSDEFEVEVEKETENSEAEGEIEIDLENELEESDLDREVETPVESETSVNLG